MLCLAVHACHVQVWDFSASADARDTEGGASKRSLLEQVDKMKKYLAAEQQQQQ
jgi:argininosuccinate lyase